MKILPLTFVLLCTVVFGVARRLVQYSAEQTAVLLAKKRPKLHCQSRKCREVIVIRHGHFSVIRVSAITFEGSSMTLVIVIAAVARSLARLNGVDGDFVFILRFAFGVVVDKLSRVFRRGYSSRLKLVAIVGRQPAI